MQNSLEKSYPPSSVILCYKQIKKSIMKQTKQCDVINIKHYINSINYELHIHLLEYFRRI